VLVDPPFEEPGEFTRLADGLAAAHQRWPTGVYLLWYPVKDTRAVETFSRKIARSGIPKVFRIEFAVGPPGPDRPLAACGMLAVNPPWPLEGEMRTVLPVLARVLGRDGPGRYRIDWLAP
jgi:23S rRNA (adenine2030-N6)-methyltransferase